MNKSQSKPQLFLPLLFEENEGQMGAAIHFRARSMHGDFYLKPNAITTVLTAKNPEQEQGQAQPKRDRMQPEWEQTITGVVLALSFVGARADVVPEGLEPSSAKYHYLKGKDPASWRTQVPVFPKMRYAGLWEGVDLELAGGEEGLKLYWHLDSPEHLSSVRLRWEGGDGLSLEEDGSLSLKHTLGELRDPAPQAWQIIDGEKVFVDCTFRLDGENEFGFTLSSEYDGNSPLVVDPLIPYSTYLGGDMYNWGADIAVDNQSFAYVTGYTASVDFPVTPGAFQTVFSGSVDAFITKLSADGSSLIYSTYLGGSDSTNGYGIAVDAQGYAYVTGITSSIDFPVTPGSFQTTLQGTNCGFITKLAADGASLLYSTYLGGSMNNYSYSIAIDDQDCAYITGMTLSSDFPVTPGAFQPTYQGNACAFITKLAADGGSLLYSTYLGGSVYNGARSIVVDAQYSAYVAGATQSNDFPVTPDAFQTTMQGSFSVFVTKFSGDGSSLLYSTYLGGSGTDISVRIAVNEQGYAYVTGYTNSTDFPVTPGAFQTTLAGVDDAFITKFAADGKSLLASTYLGGSMDDFGNSIALDSLSRAYVTGRTASGDFPITPNVIPSSFSGGTDAFVSIFSADLSALYVSYFLGGNENDSGLGIAVGQDGVVYTTGATTSNNFPVTPGAFQTTFSGVSDAYITRNIFLFLEIRQASLTIKKLK